MLGPARTTCTQEPLDTCQGCLKIVERSTAVVTMAEKHPHAPAATLPSTMPVSTLRTLLDLQPLPEDSAQESRAGCDTRPPEHPEFCSRWGSCGARAGPEQNWEVIYEIQRLGLRAPLSLGGLAGAHVHVSVRDAEIRLERLRLDLGSCS